MFRFMLAVGMIGIALVARAQQSSVEPPEAPPGEIKPAPESVVVVPGQPRLLPADLDAAPAPTGVQPAQFVTPVPAPQPQIPASRPPTSPYGATVLVPEPPTPLVRITVRGPDTAPLNQELAYKLTVTNTSEARAHSVIVRCPLPKGTKLIKAVPEPKADVKEMEWHLETLEPNASRIIEIWLKPDDGLSDITVVGKVQFEHGRYIKTRLAQPTLEMKKTGPAEGILHEALAYRIILKNPGKVPVTDAQIIDTLPDGLEYVQETSNGAIPVSKVGPAANQRTWKVGTLNPGDSRTIDYRVLPRKLGEWTSEAIASATGTQVKAGCNTVVQEAKLSLQVNGPTGDKATANATAPYLVMVHNTGSATLHNVRVNFAFPADLRVSKAAQGGQMFKDAVQWVIPRLEANQTKELAVSLTAPTAGTRELTASARADKGLEQRKKVSTSFEGIPALNWQTEGTPMAGQGQEVVYTITIKNPGTAPAKGVKVTVDLPEQVEFRQAQPQFQRGQSSVFFNTLEIPARESVTLKVITSAKKAGEARFHFELTAEGMSSGPLKNSKTTTVSPGAEPKKIDPTRLGLTKPAEEKELLIPAGALNPDVPASPAVPAPDR